MDKAGWLAGWLMPPTPPTPTPHRTHLRNGAGGDGDGVEGVKDVLEALAKGLLHGLPREGEGVRGREGVQHGQGAAQLLLLCWWG